MALPNVFFIALHRARSSCKPNSLPLTRSLYEEALRQANSHTRGIILHIQPQLVHHMMEEPLEQTTQRGQEEVCLSPEDRSFQHMKDERSHCRASVCTRTTRGRPGINRRHTGNGADGSSSRNLMKKVEPVPSVDSNQRWPPTSFIGGTRLRIEIDVRFLLSYQDGFPYPGTHRIVDTGQPRKGGR